MLAFLDEPNMIPISNRAFFPTGGRDLPDSRFLRVCSMRFGRKHRRPCICPSSEQHMQAPKSTAENAWSVTIDPCIAFPFASPPQTSHLKGNCATIDPCFKLPLFPRRQRPTRKGNVPTSTIAVCFTEGWRCPVFFCGLHKQCKSKSCFGRLIGRHSQYGNGVTTAYVQQNNPANGTADSVGSLQHVCSCRACRCDRRRGATPTLTPACRGQTLTLIPCPGTPLCSLSSCRPWATLC